MNVDKNSPKAIHDFISHKGQVCGVTLKLYIKIEWSKQKLSILKIRLTDDLEIPGRLPTCDKSALDIYLRVISTFIEKILKQNFFTFEKKMFVWD